MSKLPTLRIEQVLITHKMASDWLENDLELRTRPNGPEVPPLQRTLKRSGVEHLVGILQRGEWIFDGSPIRFDANGLLLDGQHRLNAIKESGISAMSVVEWNVPWAAFHAIDTGIHRGAGDLLHIAGFQNATTLNGAARLIMAEDSGTPPKSWKGMRFSIDQVLNWLKENPELIDAVKASTTGPTFPAQRILGPSVTAYLYYRLSAVNEAAARDFLIELGQGVGLSKGHPCLTLRERLIQAKLKKHMIPNYEVIYRAILAWNARSKGETLTTSVVATPEIKFMPVIYGRSRGFSRAKPKYQWGKVDEVQAERAKTNVRMRQAHATRAAKRGGA